MWKELPRYFRGGLFVGVLLSPIYASAQEVKPQSNSDDSNVRPAVTKVDLQIVKRAREILNSESKWNRADNRICPAEAKTVSLYCALQMATVEVGGKTEHRGAALQEARFVIDEIARDLCKSFTRMAKPNCVHYRRDPAGLRSNRYMNKW